MPDRSAPTAPPGATRASRGDAARASAASPPAASPAIPTYSAGAPFADVEHVVIVIYKDDKEHSRVTGYRAVRQLLRRAALHDEAINRAVKELHTGHAVVLVDVAEITPSEARAHLEQIAQAA